MSDNRSLLLITNRYPFHPGEEYIQTEIGYLAAEFDSVAILPTMSGAERVHGRDLPSNVQLLDLQIPHNARQRAKFLARGAREAKAPGVRHPVKLAYEKYFVGRTNAVADLAQPAVREWAQSCPTDSFTLYPYWFYVTTSVAIRLRQLVPELAHAPIITRGHGYDVNEASSPVKYLPQRQFMLEQVSRIYPTADTITERMQREWPDFATKMETSRLGVVPPGVPVRRHITDPLQVLSCSSFNPLKRLHLMAEGIAAYRDKGWDVRWTHLGGGTDKQMAALRKEIDRLGIADIVTLGGQMPNAKVYEIHRSGAHSVFLNTSSSESVSFSMSEAMGAGFPVVGTDVVGTHEILRDQVNGRLIAQHPSPDEIAEALRWVATRDDATYQAMCDASVEMCRARFDPDVLYGAFARHLRETPEVSR